MIANFEFSNDPADIALLRSVSQIAASCHAPFIASVGHQFFKVRSFKDLRSDVAQILDAPEYANWRAFRESVDSRFVGLTLPRFLLRPPYDERELVPRRQESGSGCQSGLLCGGTELCFATCLTRSFAIHGWCVHITVPSEVG